MFDLVVVGAGPSGLAAAINARRRGLSVVVLERRHPPLDKACGEGLMPGGVAALGRLGVRLGADQFRAFRGIRYVDVEAPHPGVSADGEFLEGPGMGIRRTILHAALVSRAEDIGAEIRWGIRATGLLDGAVQTDASPVPARWVVGADGLHSAVQRWASLTARRGRGRFGVRRHFEVAPWSDFVEVHWTRGAEAYVTPVGEGAVGVALLATSGAPLFDNLLGRFPGLRDRLAGRPTLSEIRGGGPFRRRVPRVATGNVALVGDSSGFLDPITGEGVSLGLKAAESLVDAIVNGDLEPYNRAHRRMLAAYWRMTSFMLLIARRPELRRRVVVTLSRSPAVFSRILAVHNGTLPLRAVGIGGAARLVFHAIVA